MPCTYPDVHNIRDIITSSAYFQLQYQLFRYYATLDHTLRAIKPLWSAAFCCALLLLLRGCCSTSTTFTCRHSTSVSRASTIHVYSKRTKPHRIKQFLSLLHPTFNERVRAISAPRCPRNDPEHPQLSTVNDIYLPNPSPAKSPFAAEGAQPSTSRYTLNFPSQI